ncbi:hypothetical protein CK203_002744 [Vitis vinifera]|uniref:Uncharacterized protein n=1 Tax=Vitis vinifera TaxID=29760 RepID=A0A438KHS7_VITVI|nr:hypothetical protein CK203_002744 [Vitis vinifera]
MYFKVSVYNLSFKFEVSIQLTNFKAYAFNWSGKFFSCVKRCLPDCNHSKRCILYFLNFSLPSPISVINKTIEEDRFDIPDVPMEED